MRFLDRAVDRVPHAGGAEHLPDHGDRDDGDDGERDRQQERRLHDRPRVDPGQPEAGAARAARRGLGVGRRGRRSPSGGRSGRRERSAAGGPGRRAAAGQGSGGGGRLRRACRTAAWPRRRLVGLLDGRARGDGHRGRLLGAVRHQPSLSPGLSSSPLSPDSTDSSGSIVTSASETGDSSVSPSSVGAVPTDVLLVDLGLDRPGHDRDRVAGLRASRTSRPGSTGRPTA